jgi:hypothetical protein
MKPVEKEKCRLEEIYGVYLWSPADMILIIILK